MKNKVAIVFGGQSSEYEISLKSAANVLKNIDKKLFDVYSIGISKDGKWFEYTGSIENIETDFWVKDEFYKIPNAERIILSKEVDVVFPLLHGTRGEDGTIQGFCNISGVPCIGSKILSSSICMDKVYSKYLLEKFDIKVTPYIVIKEDDYLKDEEYYLNKIISDFGENVFVKPSNSGSSVGVSKATTKEEIIMAIKIAFLHDKRILVEKAINAREIKVALLKDIELITAKLGEIKYKNNSFYNYNLKYKKADETELIISPELSKKQEEELLNISKKAYEILDCKDLARVDFFIDKDKGEIYLNEINTIPGFSKHSSYHILLENSGLSLDKIIKILINNNIG